MIFRRSFTIVTLAVMAGAGCAVAASVSGTSPLIESIDKHVLRSNRDGRALTWFHPRACRILADGSEGRILMTMQSIGGSDYFGPVHWSETRDEGANWSEPKLISAFDRKPVAGMPDLLAGVCDVVPQYHPMTGTVLALGHVVFYRGAKFSANDQLARYPVYAVRSPDGRWSERRVLEWDDPRGTFIYTNNCGQRIVMPNGDILLALSFGAQSSNRSVATALCSFDGETLRIKQLGQVLTLDQGRGLLEPSLVEFQDRYYLTLRAEDGRGYQSVSEDGLQWAPKEAWRWDDGEALTMSTTQQHWLAHSEALYLVYTRRDAANENVIRWRSPLWIARVDSESRRLVRSTERVALPLVGDGVSNPDEVALMGNFHVNHVTPQESWVTVGEWLPRGGARGDLLMARIQWRRPNELAGKP